MKFRAGQIVMYKGKAWRIQNVVGDTLKIWRGLVDSYETTWALQRECRHAKN